VRKNGRKYRISLKRAGLQLMYTNGLKQAIDQNLSEIDSALARRIDKARRLRNDITHEGIDVSMTQADECINAYSFAIQKLTDIL
jgi:hypothetical protein